jgi:hypothetical protein
MNNSTSSLTPKKRPNFFSPIKTLRKNTTKKEMLTPIKKEESINNTAKQLVFGGKRKSLKRKNKKTYKAKRR